MQPALKHPDLLSCVCDSETAERLHCNDSRAWNTIRMSQKNGFVTHCFFGQRKASIISIHNLTMEGHRLIEGEKRGRKPSRRASSAKFLGVLSVACRLYRRARETQRQQRRHCTLTLTIIDVFCTHVCTHTETQMYWY